MNTNINEKINENLDAELNMEQLEDVNGGIVWEFVGVCAVAGTLISAAAAYSGWRAGKKCR